MLDDLPLEVIERVARYLPQADKVRLTYVSSKFRFKVLPIIYRNIYLNETPCVLSDADPLLANNWTCLSILRPHFQYADTKLKALVRSLERSSLLSSYVEVVHCTWHLDLGILRRLLAVLVRKAHNLREFRNFLHLELATDLKAIGSRLNSLDLPPPGILPQKLVSESYLPLLRDLVRHSRLDNLTSLNIYLDPGVFFTNYAPGIRKLRIRELGLSLRGDNYSSASFNTPRLTYSGIFDPNFLERLTILSWHEKQDLDIYEHYHLFELLEFKNLKELTLMSFFANDNFLQECIRSFCQLRRLKLDYMFGHSISSNIVELMAQSPSRKTLQYLDLKFWELDPYLITIEQRQRSRFEINETCKCDSCKDVFRNIIRKKLFPSQAALNIESIEDVTKRDIITKIISVDPIVPYAQFVDTRPGMMFVENPILGNARTINKALGVSGPSQSAFTSCDVVRVYHAHLHSMKRTFDFFLQKFPCLNFLSVNDVPTIVCEGPGGQRFNMPVFNSAGYVSNQIYEVVDEENLFS
ncbi:LAQU0S25e00166g1_1 [Lachancea quebecensis]|uniref:LAQU0S25e00166g1_1 n=1 Tax=Lachancea quebecensis TaxID=1654605 RepID=A0A0P1KXH1_9SACH|nr:LAQU0S25e00166g1_1 [Lachancea quebecensis]